MPNYGAENLKNFLTQFGAGAKQQQEAGNTADLQRAAQEASLRQLLQGKQEEHRLAEEGMKARRSEVSQGLQQDPSRGYSASKEGFSVTAPQKGTDPARAASQKRLAATALNKLYTDQTKPIKEKQQMLQEIAPLLEDPSNIDDVQFQRTVALAVNKGALTKEDVEQVVPTDIEQKGKQLWNYLQPLGSAFGMKKKPMFSPENRANLGKLVSGKLEPLNQQLQEAGQQVHEQAPFMASELAAEDPQGLETLVQSITQPRVSQQKRVTQGIQKGTAPKTPKAPGAPAGGLSFEEFKKRRAAGTL